MRMKPTEPRPDLDALIKKVNEEVSKLTLGERQALFRAQRESVARNYSPGARQGHYPPDHSVVLGSDDRLRIVVEVDKHILTVHALDQILTNIRQRIMREIIEPQELWQEQNRT